MVFFLAAYLRIYELTIGDLKDERYISQQSSVSEPENRIFGFRGLSIVATDGC